MEEHHHHHHPIIQQYGITDLRHLIDPPPPLQSQPSFETLMMMNRPISAAEIAPHYGLATAPTSSLSGGGGFEVAGDAGTGRWPRQETLTLLEIRSRLDSKFKDANQKGPLWDEVSRIMSEEHGYQRSGKKCREKFENLYKYYKKTKEGKAGRQDGKHYRFFRQLEALYGETSNNNNIINNANPNYMNDNQVSHNYNNLGLFHAIPTPREASNNNDNDSSESFESSYSSDNNDVMKRRPRGWKAKIKEFVDSHMKKLMERQEAWLEKLMRTLEQKERERGLREEEWRREETSRIEREHRFWAKERAWIEARDSALMEALKSLTPRDNRREGEEEEEEAEAEVRLMARPELGLLNPNWTELEISRLIELRTGIESRFDREEDLWDDVAGKMACLGHDRSGSVCREKWESINSSSNNSDRNSKKRKENGNYNNFLNNNNESSTSLYNRGGYENCDQMNDGTSSSPSNANVGHSTNSHDHHHNHHHNHVVSHDGCFPFFMGEGSENLWESYGVKINKGGQNN